MSLFEELRKRKVFRLIAAYVVVAWLLVQVVTAIEEPLRLPEWFDTAVIVLLGLGFPIVIILGWVYDMTPDGVVRENDHDRPAVLLRIDYGKIALVAVLILGAFLAGNFLTTVARPSASAFDTEGQDPLRRFHIPVDGDAVENRERLIGMAITPDGETVVAIGWFNGKPTLMSRGLDELEFVPIPGTENSRGEFTLSPDGKIIAFQDDVGRTLMTVPLSGGIPVRVFDLRGGAPIRSLTWGENGDIVFGRYEDPSLYRVASTGGSPELLARPADDRAYKLPGYIPGSEVLMLTVGGLGQSASHADRLAFLRPDGELIVTSIEGASAKPVSDRLVVYYSNGALLATTFDLASLDIGRDVVSLGSEVLYFQTAYFDVARVGSLIYLTDWRLEPNSIVWVDRAGDREPIPVPPGNYDTPRMSPDGERIAVIRRSSYGPDMVILAADGRELFQLTAEESMEQFPVWNPDGGTLYFSQERIDQLYRSDVRRGAVPERLTDLPFRVEPGSISADGSELYFHARSNPANPNLAVLDTSSLEMRVLMETDYGDQFPAISPDGRWLAYQSARTGVVEIWVRPYPDIEAGAWQISSQGGVRPTWGDDSSEIFFWSHDRTQMMAVRIETDSGMRATEPEPLFATVDLDTSGTGYYDRSSRRFLLNTKPFGENEFRRELKLIQNWPALLEQ